MSLVNLHLLGPCAPPVSAPSVSGQPESGTDTLRTRRVSWHGPASAQCSAPSLRRTRRSSLSAGWPPVAGNVRGLPPVSAAPSSGNSPPVSPQRQRPNGGSRAASPRALTEFRSRVTVTDEVSSEEAQITDNGPLAAFWSRIESRVANRVKEKETGEGGLRNVSQNLATESNSAQALVTGLPAAASMVNQASRISAVERLRALEEGRQARQKAIERALLNVELSEREARVASVERDELRRIKEEVARLRARAGAGAGEGSEANVAILEARVVQLEKELATRVAPSVHDEALKRVRELTAELSEKDTQLAALRRDFVTQRNQLAEKVQEMVDDMRGRVSRGEAEAAIRRAVSGMERELRRTEERAEALSQQIQNKDAALLRLTQEWGRENEGLRSRVQSLQSQLSVASADRKAQLGEMEAAFERTASLQGEVTRLQGELAAARVEAAQSLQEAALRPAEATSTSGQPSTSSSSSTSGSLSALEMAASVSHTPEEALRLLPQLLETAARQLALIQQSAGGTQAAGVVSPELPGLILRALEGLQRGAAGAGGGREGAGEGSSLAVAVVAAPPAAPALPADTPAAVVSRAEGPFFGPPVNIAPVAPTVTVEYLTSWDTAYIHFTTDGQSWTEAPGQLLEDGVSPTGEAIKTIRVPADHLEFVMTNGAGAWDRDPKGKNYRVDGPGRYLLSFGCVTSVPETMSL